MADEKKTRLRDSAIDDNLRRAFQPTLDEDVPDRFKELLQKLKEKDRGEEGRG